MAERGKAAGALRIKEPPQRTRRILLKERGSGSPADHGAAVLMEGFGKFVTIVVLVERKKAQREREAKALLEEVLRA
jgi:hypothetical protein